MIKVGGMETELKCKQCGHRWVRRVMGKMPVQCPRCKRTDWNREVWTKRKEKGEGVWEK